MRDKKKPEFVAFKQTVWHESFSLIIQSIVGHSKMGCYIHCGDNVRQWIFPFVIILSADYKEQCIFIFFMTALFNDDQVRNVSNPGSYIEISLPCLSCWTP